MTDDEAISALTGLEDKHGAAMKYAIYMGLVAMGYQEDDAKESADEMIAKAARLVAQPSTGGGWEADLLREQMEINRRLETW